MREKWNLFLYALKNCFVAIGRHFTLCLSSIFAIALALSLVAGVYLLGDHVQSFSSNVAGRLSIHAVLDPAIMEQAQLNDIQSQIEAVDNVESLEFSSKDQELENMIEEKGEAFAQYRGENNPLANAYFVFVKDENELESTSRQIRAISGVESVSYGGRSARDLVQVLNCVQYGAMALSVLLLFLALYMVYSAVRSSISTRMEEVAAMRTVGATNAFIRIPFVVEGVILGLLGALIPWLLVRFLYPVFYQAFEGRLFISSLALMAPDLIYSRMAWLLFGSGGLCGLLASFLAATRFLKASR